MYHVDILQSITETTPQIWNGIVAPDSLISTYNFLLTIEQSNINDCVFYYPMIYKKNKLVAHTCIYTITTDAVTHGSPFFLSIVKKIRNIFPRFLYFLICECGSPVAAGTTISLHKDINPREIIPLLEDVMKTIARNHKAPLLLFRDFNPSDSFWNNLFAKSSFFPINNMPDIMLQIHWQSFDEYLSGLTASYRRQMLAHLAPLSHPDLSCKYLTSFDTIADIIQSLYYNCYNHSTEHKREILTTDFFSLSSKYLAGKVMLTTLYHKKTLIGFTYNLCDTSTLRLLYVGLDYQQTSSFNTYFILFLKTLQYAIEHGFDTLELGITSYDFKLRMGGQYNEMIGYAAARNPILHAILRLLRNQLFPPTPHLTRHPFKEKK